MQTAVPAKRPGQEIMRFFLPEGLKERYKRVCSLKGTSMTEDLIAYIEGQIDEYSELIKSVDKKMGDG